jgi:hypothetical protein
MSDVLRAPLSLALLLSLALAGCGGGGGGGGTSTTGGGGGSSGSASPNPQGPSSSFAQQCAANNTLAAAGLRTATLAPTGVDASVTATFHFPGGVTSQFRCGFDASSMNAFEAMGAKAALRFPVDFWGSEAVELVTRKAPVQRFDAPHAVNGFEGEIAEAQACIRAGLLESPRMPHSETLGLLRWSDAIRERLPGGVNKKG